MNLNLKLIMKKNFVLILTPILCSSLTACSTNNTYSSFLSYEEMVYLKKNETYNQKSIDDIIIMICENHNLLQVDEILHYNINLEEVKKAQKIIYEALSNSFYNSVKMGYYNYLLYKKDNFNKLDGYMISHLETLSCLEDRYLIAYKNYDSYEVVKSALEIVDKIKEISVENIISFKLNKNVNMVDVSFKDKSNLSELYNLRNQNNDSINSEYNLLYIKHIFEMLYSDYEMSDGVIYIINKGLYESMLRENLDVMEPSLEDVEEISFYMDSNGIIWDSKERNVT